MDRHDDLALRAFDDGEDLGLFRERDLKLVERSFQDIHENLPLRFGDFQMDMGISHGTAGIPLRSSGGGAQLFGHQILEAGRRHSMMGLVDLGIGVQRRALHHAIDELVDDDGDREHAAKSFV